ncbi:hypothetical protein [Halodesulfovibrio spirochaetisodalis]|uniref:Uncharacterized protein n=1 Tax=Halodesulfovibrio spirochaetisodalis TaxID=1560234 RepID=A0A1B7XD29_9BACT|nr:hypothetical protein [Halodesulfovibrio spirochaetisodalis]OBQ51900.1 hypothetical protein SP90_08695 [Halodesulfovibrio spirochaetisodalis]
MNQQTEHVGQTDHVMNLYEIARSLRYMHEDCSERYPELVFILKSMETFVYNAAAHFDGMEERMKE